MNINYEYHDVTASPELEQYTQEKVNTILERSQAATGIDVYFKVNDANLPQDRMVAGLRLDMPGETLFAESISDSFHNSVNDATSELLTQVERYNDKIKSY